LRGSVEPPKLKRRERERKKIGKNRVLPHNTAGNRALAKTGLVEKSI